MASYYDTLGVSPDATEDEIKAAFRGKALEHHPDLQTPSSAESTDFKKILEAYEVLKNQGKRARYDALRRGGPDPFTGDPFSSPFSQRPAWGQQGEHANSDTAFDEAFERWWRRQGFGPTVDETARSQQRRADHRARAEAWQAEKAEARLNRERFERIRRKASAARAERHARVLRRFWHTHHGLVWQDALVMSLLLASTVGAAQLLRTASADSREPKNAQGTEA